MPPALTRPQLHAQAHVVGEDLVAALGDNRAEVLSCVTVRWESLGRHRVAETTVCGVPTMLLPLGCFLYKSSISSNLVHREAELESQIYR